jgi:two-component system cell cycle response regulator
MCACILVIDDDPVNLDLMTYLLTAFAHEPIAAEGALKGLEALQSNPVQLILCDIQMPRMDGFEFLRRLSSNVRRTIPVIGVTALAMVGDREKVLAAGFDGYMAKPITPETFVQDVDKFLSAHQRGVVAPRRQAAPPVAHLRPAAEERKHLRILVADNEPANLEILRLHLDHAGYDVVTARSGNMALELAKASPPEAIVSDIHMPDGDGFALIRGVRQDPRLRDTPVIFVSATSQGRADVDRGISLGAYRFLVRPFEPQVLLDTLNKCLGKEEREQ